MSQSGWLKALCWGALGVMGLVLAAPTAFADGRGSLKDAPVQAFSWQGFYIGDHAGLATGTTGGDTGFTTTDYDINGALYGLQAGYNFQRGTTVFGIEATWSHSTVQGNTACLVVFDCKRDVDWVATVVGRLGMASGRSLLYSMAGVAWADVNTNVSIIGVPLLSASETHVGWTYGFGFEHAFTDRISTRIEYAHIDLGSETHNLAFIGGGGITIPDKVDLKMDSIRLGVNIRLF
jgi:outer membrane immunogenic protein